MSGVRRSTRGKRKAAEQAAPQEGAALLHSAFQKKPRSEASAGAGTSTKPRSRGLTKSADSTPGNSQERFSKKFERLHSKGSAREKTSMWTTFKTRNTTGAAEPPGAPEHERAGRGQHMKQEEADNSVEPPSDASASQSSKGEIGVRYNTQQSSGGEQADAKREDTVDDVVDDVVDDASSAHTSTQSSDSEWGDVRTSFFDHSETLDTPESPFWGDSDGQAFTHAVTAYLEHSLRNIMMHTFASDAESYYECATRVLDAQIICICRARQVRGLSAPLEANLNRITEDVMKKAMEAYVASPVCNFFCEFSDELLDYVCDAMKKMRGGDDERMLHPTSIAEDYLAVLKTNQFERRFCNDISKRADARMKDMIAIESDLYVDMVVAAAQKEYRAFLNTGKVTSQVCALINELFQSMMTRMASQTLNAMLKRTDEVSSSKS